MRKILSAGVLPGYAVIAVAEVSLVQEDGKLTVKNQFYQAEFDAGKGYAMTAVNVKKPGKRLVRMIGQLVLSADGEQEQYIGHYSSRPQEFHQFKSKATCSVLEQGPERAIFKLAWSFTGGNVIDTVTCAAGGPLIRHDVELSFDRVMFEADYVITTHNLGDSRTGKNLFYPDGKRVTSVWNTGFFSACPTWKFAWNPVRKVGIGLIAPPGQDWSSIHYMTRCSKDGWPGDVAIIGAQHEPLRYEKLPGKVRFSVSVIAGGSPELARELAAARLPKPKTVTLDEVWPRKLITRIGADNVTSVALTNNSNSPKTVKLVSKAVWGLSREQAVDTRELNLAPGATGKYEIEWRAEPMLWGIAFRTEAFVAGKLIDSREEYCAVSNFPPAVAGISIINVGMARQEGSEPAWGERFRRGYMGVFEYYCWTPSTIDGLAPEEEEWEPHTESQGAYNVTLTKGFLKELIRNSHEHGVYAYSWITGLFSFRKGLKNPKLFQYCANGQPSLYNGRIYGDTRFATGKANAYDAGFAYEWGQEMGRSVDMFDWDGCRWDWNFIPNAPSDPLYTDLAGDIPDWYDWKGTPSRELYPDPDATAVASTRAWRRGVEENHPRFIYGTNFHGDIEQFEKFPKHSAEQSRKSLVLFEYLLNFSKEEYATWQKWAQALTEANQRTREHGAQSVVGSMRGLLPGTVSRNLAQYVCFASGVKWWEGPIMPDGLDQGYKRYRFMVRFAEYYFDDAFRLVPEQRRLEEVAVSGSPRIFWQQFVYERNKDGFRDVTVHLINLPEGDYICQRYEAPPHRRNVAIKVQPQAGERLVEAYAMLPNPSPRAVKLKMHAGAGILPELIDAAIVLFRFGK